MEILIALHIESREKVGRNMITEENFCLVLDLSSTFPSRNEKPNEDVAMRFFSLTLFSYFIT